MEKVGSGEVRSGFGSVCLSSFENRKSTGVVTFPTLSFLFILNLKSLLTSHSPPFQKYIKEKLKEGIDKYPTIYLAKTI